MIETFKRRRLEITLLLSPLFVIAVTTALSLAASTDGFYFAFLANFLFCPLIGSICLLVCNKSLPEKAFWIIAYLFFCTLIAFIGAGFAIVLGSNPP